MRVINIAVIIFLSNCSISFSTDFMKDKYFWDLPWEYNPEIVQSITDDPDSFIEYVQQDSCAIGEQSIIYVASILKIRKISDWINQVQDTSHNTLLLKSMYFYRVFNSNEDKLILLNLLYKSGYADSWAMAIVTVLSYDEKIFRIFESKTDLLDGLRGETVLMNMSWLMYWALLAIPVLMPI